MQKGKIKRGRVCACIFIALVYILIGFVPAQGQNLKTESTQETIIVHMTDPQFGFKTNNEDFVFETANFEKAILATNKLEPDAVVITGDLTHRINDATQITEFKRILSLLDPNIPVYTAAGNHDLADGFSQADLEKYRSNYGKDYYSFKVGELFGIVLNSQMIAQGENVKMEYEKQNKWLGKSLREAKNSGLHNIVVFQHHPYFLETIDEKDEYFNIPSVVRKKYLDLFIENNVAFVFTGHLHYYLEKKYKGLDIITTGPIGPAFKEQPSGVRILKITKNGLQHQYYSLDEYERLVR